MLYYIFLDNMDLRLKQSKRTYSDESRKLQHEIRKLKTNLNLADGFLCEQCNKTIKHRANYLRHCASHNKTLQCFLCNRKFNRMDNLKRHERGHVTGYQRLDNSVKCFQCNFQCLNYTSLFDHVRDKHHNTIANSNQQFGGSDIQHRVSTDTALDNAVQVTKLFPTEQDKYDLLTFFYRTKDEIKGILTTRCATLKHIKWYLNVHVEMVRISHDGESDISHPYFKSPTFSMLSQNDVIDDDLNVAYQKQFKSFDEYIARGSGYTLKHVLELEVHTLQYRPLGGSSYIPSPKTI